MPRLQVLTPVFPPAVGGIESLTHGLVERWDGPVEVLTLEEPGSAEWDAGSRCPVHRVRNVPRGGRKSIARLTYAAVAQTRRFKPDIVLSMHVRCGYAAALSKTLSGAAWLQYYHAKEVPTWPGATRLCANRADQGVAVSRYTKALVQAVSPLAGPLTVIPPGIPAPRQAPERRHARPTMLTVARINDPYKGHDVLLEAMPMIRDKVPDVRWVVVGVGDRLPWLRNEVRTRGLTGHVEILGLVDDAKRDELFVSSDVFVLPSRTSDDGTSGEGFGIVYAEAAAVGLPIVAGAQGGVVDAVQNEVSGLLVDPTDARQVADAVTTLLCDDDRRARMAVAARQWSRRFEWDTVADAFQELAVTTLHRTRR
ncbi:glycosyltransferase family 4 protein [Actinoplanes sp. N902-109]|uniref:glycosyltransferase family 4 protein n=1 Tax=Actinoplanes sp. (strain N902-109) TaxID=649831 RepID=UPI00059EEEA1|nr:glycosyltransferase family 4 protein [Actinoplanes sp. N902-109]